MTKPRKSALFTTAIAAAMMCTGACATEQPRAARSVHLYYGEAAEKCVSAEISIAVTSAQTNSYYMALGWDSGYCGLQQLQYAGRVFIFSVWDPGNPFDLSAREETVPEELRAKVLYSDPRVDVTRFDREGTGAKTMVGLNWQEGEKVSVKIDCEPDGTNRVIYTCSLKMNGSEWTKVAAISTIHTSKSGPYMTQLHSFVEDFWRTGVSATWMRRAEYSSLRTRSEGSEKWVDVTSAMFTADGTKSTNIDAGLTADGAFFLQTGGDTENSHTPLWGVMTLPGAEPPKKPILP